MDGVRCWKPINSSTVRKSRQTTSLVASCEDAALNKSAFCSTPDTFAELCSLTGRGCIYVFQKRPTLRPLFLQLPHWCSFWLLFVPISLRSSTECIENEPFLSRFLRSSRKSALGKVHRQGFFTESIECQNCVIQLLRESIKHCHRYSSVDNFSSHRFDDGGRLTDSILKC